MGKRVIFIVMDSFGIGEEPDAADFGDLGTNTLRSCLTSDKFSAENLRKLGLFNIDGVNGLKYSDSERIEAGNTKASPIDEPIGMYGRMQEASKGKDTTIGHWEIAGIISENPLPVFPDGFPDEVLDKFKAATGRGVLCNKPYSGTTVINEYGDEHVKSGDLIVYTSADSVFQIAAHEDVVPVETLYEYCRIAREILTGEYGVGRVIARPFIGDKNGNYTRTANRHDFSLKPPMKTMLDNIIDDNKKVYSVGKIKDIFAGVGISEFVYTKNNMDGVEKTLEYMDEDFEGLIFTNLVDFDMQYGHRRDIDGYANAIAEFDKKLPVILNKMRDDDVLMITGDHGCDPGYLKTTDHTREYVPFLVYGKNIKPKNLGTHVTFSDMGSTVLDYLGVPSTIKGKSCLN